jgi:hypothetical protein
MECYSVIKKNKIMLFAGKGMGTGDYCIEQGKPISERQILHVFTHMQNLDLRKSGTVGKEAAGG